MRLTDDVRKCVVFLGLQTTVGTTTTYKFGGSGFFISVPFTPRAAMGYLVTAKHVAEALAGPFVVGFNKKGGLLDTKDIDAAIWHYHEDQNIDLAVMPLVLTQESDWMTLPIEALSNEGDIYQRGGIGEEVHCGHDAILEFLFGCDAEFNLAAAPLAEEHAQLDELTRKGKRSAQLLTKARILLKADVKNPQHRKLAPAGAALRNGT